MSDALVPFVYSGLAAPYTDTPMGWHVFPVRPKTGLAMARTGSVAHHMAGTAAVFDAGRLRYGARWLCGKGSQNVILLSTADQAPGGACRACQIAAAGPALYRCYGTTGELLYIGSTNNRGRRMAGHKSITPWWDEVADVRFESFPSLHQARIAEVLAIATEHPLRNRHYTPRGAA